MLTQLALNRALLARQLYLERSTLSIPAALEQICALQNQYAPAGYISLWSRLQQFERSDLTGALVNQQVIHGTLMRATIHLASPTDFALFTAAVREERTEWWMRSTKTSDTRVMIEAAKKIEGELSKGPARRNELIARLGIETATWNGATNFVDLIRVPPSGTWEQRRADLYGLARLAVVDWEKLSHSNEGLVLSIKRYLNGFGPATIKDLSSFLGLKPATIRPALRTMELIEDEAEDGSVLIDLPGASRPDPETHAPPRFLPVWDAALLVHARRTQILPERFRPLIFNTKTPHSMNTFLVDGQVAGTWRFEDGDIELSPFETIDRRHRSALEEEAERLRLFHS